MKNRVMPIVIYAVTTLFFIVFLDALYGGEPIIHYAGLIYLATAGAVLVAGGSVLCLFNLRTGVICALLGCFLSWPYFAIQMHSLPWLNFFWLMRYRPETVAASLALIAATAYSGASLWHMEKSLRGKG